MHKCIAKARRQARVLRQREQRGVDVAVVARVVQQIVQRSAGHVLEDHGRPPVEHAHAEEGADARVAELPPDVHLGQEGPERLLLAQHLDHHARARPLALPHLLSRAHRKRHI